MSFERTVRFSLGGLIFEYDEEKDCGNVGKHGISFKTAARVFFDYDRVELVDDEHSIEEDRYNTIGDTSADGVTVIGNLKDGSQPHDILFVVYAKREITFGDGNPIEVTRLISTRLATNFERGLYYGKYS